MAGIQLEIFPVAALFEAPDFIERDNYTGRVTVAFDPAKYRVSVFTAGELADQNRRGIFFESFGHVAGAEHFIRTRYIADANGRLHCYDGLGGKVLTHPSARSLRVLVAK